LIADIVNRPAIRKRRALRGQQKIDRRRRKKKELKAVGLNKDTPLVFVGHYVNLTDYLSSIIPSPLQCVER
jgi:hypothetical protein